MEFLIDADLPNSTVEPFHNEGFETVHVREVDLGTAPDEEVSAYADRNDYVLITRDRDFGNPLLPQTIQAGVVILKLHNYSPGDLRARLTEFLKNVELSEIRHSVVVVENSRYRIRTQS